MKSSIVGDSLMFHNPDEQEKKYLKELLTWTDSYSHETQTLLYENNECIYTFANLARPLQTKFLEANSLLEVEGLTTPKVFSINIPNDYLKGITLFDFQIGAMKRCILHKKGIVKIPTGGGKSEVITGVNKFLLENNLAKKILIVVPTTLLKDQIYERLGLRGIPFEYTKFLGEKNWQNSPIVITVINSLYDKIKDKNEIVLEYLNTVDCLEYDEGHHTVSPSYLSTLYACKNAIFILMFTATPFESPDIFKNYRDSLLVSIAGNIIFEVSQQYLRKLGLIAEPVCFFSKTQGILNNYSQRYNKLYKNQIINSSFRNKKIVYFANLFAKWGFKTVIAVSEQIHAEILMKMLNLEYCKPISVFGGKSSLVFSNIGELENAPIDYMIFKDNFEKGIYNVAIVTQVAQEGFDLPLCHCLVMARTIHSKKEYLQILGRPLRGKKGINRAYVADFDDNSHVYFKAQTNMRKSYLKEIEATIIDDEFKFMNMIYNHAKTLGFIKEEK